MGSVKLLADNEVTLLYTGTEYFPALIGAIEAAEVMHGSLWAKLSDHAPIVASLSLG